MPGTTSAWCGLEDDFNLDVARDLARDLEATGRFTVRLARVDGQGPRYAERIRDADAWGADALLSIHADARGFIRSWEPTPGVTCPVSEGEAGFSVLVADSGPDALVEGRRTLGRALVQRMREAGFLAYDGVDYGDVYEGDPAAPGLFYDRHLPGQRIAMARGPAMPSALVETHHALHAQESARWLEPATRDAFARAVMAALEDLLGGDPAGLDDLEGSR